MSLIYGFANMNESLLNTKKFSGLFSIQFLNVMNDNLLKNAILVMIAFNGITLGSFKSSVTVNISTLLFILPFFLFASYAGKLADKMNKVQLIRIIKFCEVFITLVACGGILSKNIWLMLIAILAMSTHSTFFSPIKYSILPQYFSQRKKLLLANSYVEVGSFIAVLVGQVIGSWFIGNSQPQIVIWILASATLAGLIFSWNLEKTPTVGTQVAFHWNLFKDNWDLYRQITTDPKIKNTLHAIAWFWALGVIYTIQMALLTKHYLGGSAQVFSILLIEFSIAIGLGSLVCTYISNGTIHKKFIPFALIGISILTLFILLLNNTSTPHTLSVAEFSHSLHGIINYGLIFGIGFMAGFYSITCYNELQLISPLKIFSQVIAVNNILNAAYMLIITIACTLLLMLINLWWLFFIVIIANLIIAYNYWQHNFPQPTK